MTAIAALVLASVALAANVYTVDGSTKPSGKGSPAKPLPIALGFDFQVESDDPSVRGTPIETYAIGSEGLVTYPKVAKTCTFSQANRDGSIDPKCSKAKVGNGLVQNVVGPGASPTVKIFCNLKLGLYNISGLGKNGGMAIRLDGDPKEPPLADPNDKTINCPTPIHGAIKAKFVKTKIGGLPASDLRFTVPPELLHPSGLDTTVRNTVSKILKKTGKVKVKGKSRKVGFYSAVGCKGGKRSIQVTFVSETGQTTPVSKDKKC